uniref:C-type lectin n=1 Tax=Chlorobium chlorochromatii (strain CaD3) TaxID=340177 RepID=Q3ART7_CHLCH
MSIIQEHESNDLIANATSLTLVAESLGSTTSVADGVGTQSNPTQYNSWSDPDYWRIELLAGYQISFSILTPSSSLQPYAELRDAANNTVAYATADASGESVHLVPYTLTASGSYYVVVGKNYYTSDGGDYELHVETAPFIKPEDDDNNTIDKATELVLSENPASSGLLLGVGMGEQDPATMYNHWSDPDYWRIEVLAGDLVSITVQTPDSELNPYVELRNAADGNLVGSNDEGAGNDAFISSYEIKDSGSYFVLVGKDYYSGGGTYSVQVDVARGIQMESDANYDNGNLTQANALHLSAEITNTDRYQVATVAGAIMLPEYLTVDVDVFALGRLNAENTVELTSLLPSTSNLTPLVTLLDSAGNVVTDSDGNSADGNFSATLTKDDDYYVQVERGYQYNGHTYLLTNNGMNWTAAQEYAESLGGHLVTIDDASEQQWLFSQFGSTNSWIGLNDEVTESIWQWGNGATSTYRYWGDGHPYGGEYYNYAYIATDGKWYSGNETWGYYALIEIENTASAANSASSSTSNYLLDVRIEDSVAPRVESITLPANGSSVDDPIGATITVTMSEKLEPATVKAGLREVWVRDGHYYTVTDAAVSWTDANTAATALGGQLVNIESAEEQAWLLSMLDGRYGDVWLGLSDTATEGTWVSANGETVWVYGAETNSAYANWGDSQPYYQWDENYDYAAMNGSGKWYASYGSNAMRGVIEIVDNDSDSDGLSDALDPYDNDPLNAWDLREAGADGVFDTPDDVIHRLLLKEAYNGGTAVNLLIEDGTLGAGSYRFTANTTLTDIVGNVLDGDSAKIGSEPYVHYFTITHPAGVTAEGGRNNILQNATTLSLNEDPAGKGLWLAHGVGNQDPATIYNHWSDPDYWKLELQQGDLVSIYVNTPDSSLDAYVELRNANDGYVASSNDDGASNDSFISRYVVTESGTYYVLVGKGYYSGGGAYELQVDVAKSIQMESDANYSNNPLSGANLLSFVADGNNQVATVAGAIMESEGQPDIDVYALGRFNAGNTITLTANLPSTSGLSPIVTLLDEAGHLLLDADAHYADGTCTITLEDNGNYYAQVEKGYQYNEYTYIVSSTTMSWEAAHIYADMIGGHIVTINDADEQQWLTEQFGWTSSWIGMNDAALDGTWVWDDGTTVEYQNWGSGHPYTWSNDYNYGYLATDGKWYSSYNGYTYRALIEIEIPHTAEASTNSLNTSYLLDVSIEDDVAPRVESTTLPTNNSTVDNLVGATFSVTMSEKLDAATVKAGLREVWVRDGHYYTVTDAAMSWQDAAIAAQALGGQLVNIESADEQAWVQSMLDGRYGDVWLGLNDAATENTWVSADGSTTWIYGAETNSAYTNWGDSQPYYQWDENYDYAAMNSSGKWYATYNNSSYNLMRGVIEIVGSDSDNDGMPDALDPYDNDLYNAWDLREAGADGVFDTTDDIIHRLLLNGTYVDSTTVNLLIEDGSLNAGSYRFTVNTTVTDIVDNTLNGNVLNGDGDSTAGDRYEHFFTIAPPAGVTTEGGRNNISPNATALTFSEDPSGKGLWLAYGMGNQDPATMYNHWSDPDYWKIELQAGDYVSVYVNTPESDLDPYVELLNTNNGGVAWSNDDGAHEDSLISRYAVTESGTYYVLVGKGYYSGGGSYELQVDVARGIDMESDANYSNSSFGNANRVTLVDAGVEQRATVAGNIMAPESTFDRDIYALGRLNAGNRVELNTAMPSSSDLMPVVTLWQADGTMVADSDGNYTDGQFNALLAADSDYYTQVERGYTFGEHTYLLSSSNMTWSAAKTYAESLGGHLVTIETAEEQAWINELLGSSTSWIGIYDAADNGTWVLLDGTQPTYTNWEASQPSTWDNYNYGHINYNQLWYAGLESWGLPVLVEIDTVGTLPSSSALGSEYILDITVTDGVAPRVESTTLPTNNSTTDNLVGATFSLTMSEKLDAATVKAGAFEVWKYNGNYYALTESAMTWVQAEAAAVALGGHLASVLDANEQAWVQSMLDGRYGNVWLGLNDAATEGSWVYSDNNLALYTNWASNEPYYQWDGNYDYAYMHTNGEWRNTDGSSTMRGLIKLNDTDSDKDGLPDAFDLYLTDSRNAWDLREAGADGVFDTADDIIHRVLLNGAYENGTTVNLLIEDGSLGAGSYRFTANATLTDIVGNALDGNGDGTAGDYYQQFFTIAPPTGITVENGRDNISTNATALALHEDPSGKGLWLAHGMGNQDPATMYNHWSDPDYWKIELQAGDLLSVYVNTPESNLNPYVELRNATDSQISYNNDDGAKEDAFISRHLIEQSGTYYVLVGKDYYSYGGSYELLVDVARGIDMEYDPQYRNDSLGGSQSLGFSAAQNYQLSTVAGAIMGYEYGYDYDVYNLGRFNAGNTIELTITQPSTSSLVPLVTLYNAAGTPVTDANWNPADGTFNATLTHNDDYYAKVEHGYTFAGHTYVLTHDNMYWSDAEAYAEALGGHLVTINNAFEQQWLANTFSWANPWIGISDSSNTNEWHWSDGSQSLYRNWGDSQPDNYYDYGYLNPNGYWYTGANNWNYRALIEFDSMGIIPAATDPTVTNYLLDVRVEDSVAPRVEMVSLPANNSTIEHLVGASITVTMSEKLAPATVQAGMFEVWEHNGHYYTLTDRAKSWQDAEASAVALGGHLVSINDATEQAWLQSMLDGRYGNVWIGLSDAAAEATWQLTDGTTSTYANWASNEPYYQWESNYDYAYMNSNGQWGASYNTNSMRGVIELVGTDSDNDGMPDQLDTYRNDPYNAWDLREAGADGTFDTADDVIHRLILNKGYSSGSTFVNLLIEDGSLNAGSYRFTANATLTDIVGNHLDGNANSIGGDAYMHYFTIAPPAGVIAEGGRNNTMQNATVLPLTQDPAGRGLWLGHGIGNQDPGFAYEYGIDVDYWKVELQKDDLVSISVNTPDSNLDPNIALYDANGTYFDYSNNEGPDYDAFISRYVVTTTGTYYIKVDKDYYSGPGSYELQVDVARGIQMEYDRNYDNDPLSGANVLTFTQAGTQRIATVAGNMMSAGDGQVDDDTYALGAIEAGNTILLGITIPDMGDLRPVVEIYNAQEQLVGLDPNPSSGVARFDVITTGTYFARVLPFTGSGSFGHYLLDAAITPTVEAQFADLAIDSKSVIVPATPQSGSTITIAWSVGNYGKIATEQSTWQDRVVLSLNSRLGDADDLLLATVEHNGVLDPATSYNASVDVVLPTLLEGNARIFVTSDVADVVEESFFEINNTAEKEIVVSLTPYADLHVAEASMPSTLQADTTFIVTATIANNGTGAPGTGIPNESVNTWVDKLVLSGNAVLGDADDEILETLAHTGGLDAGSSYEVSFDVTLSAEQLQDHLFIVSDSGDAVFEAYNSGMNERRVNHLPEGSVVINGNALQSTTLTVTQTINDADGMGDLLYQWYADDEAIAGATQTTLWLDTSLIDKQISVVAHYEDGYGVEEAVESTPTEAVVADTTAPTVVSFAPTDNATEVGLNSSITVEFSEAIERGSGTISLHTGSPQGTLVESYDVSSSYNLHIAGSTLTITPNNRLDDSTHYYVVFEEGSMQDMAGNDYAGTVEYDFTTVVNHAPIIRIPHELSFADKVDYATGDEPYDISTGYFNNDEWLDVAVVNSRSKTFAIYNNNGNGSFTLGESYNTPHMSFSIASGEVTGDDYVDLIVSNYYNNTVSVWSNSEIGTFTETSSCVTANAPSDVRLADTDGDTDLDIITLHQDSNSISIIKNNGDNTFANYVVYATGNHPSSLAVSDLNNDGFVDLMVTNTVGDSVSVLINDTYGAFSEKVDYSIVNPSIVISRDVDADGDADMVVGRALFGYVSVLKNNGDGTFTAQADYRLADNPASLNSVDVDGDGMLDIIVGYRDELSTISVLKNNGDGTFGTPIDYPAGTKSYSIASGDFNNDEQSDLVVVHYDTDTFTLHLNNSVEKTATAFTEQTPVAVSSNITINDPDGDASWNGGCLQVQITANAESLDRLLLPTVAGNGVWLDSANNNALMAGELRIGEANVVGVQGSAAWHFSFNEHATNALVQEVTRSIMFNNNSNTPSELERTITFTVTDTFGDWAAVDQQITVTADDDPAPITHDLYGNITFWKSGNPLNDVQPTLASKPMENHDQEVAFRNLQQQSDGSYTVELWASTTQTDIHDFQLQLYFPESTTSVSWQASSTLNGWISVLSDQTTGQVVLGGVSTAQTLQTGSVQIGTLSFSAPDIPDNFTLTAASGWIGTENIVPTSILCTATDTTGDYRFEDVTDGWYRVAGESNTNMLANAVTTEDALAALKMAVELNPNEPNASGLLDPVSPYQFLAADINRDGKVRANDALNILKMAVNYANAPTDEWIYVRQDHQLADMDRSHVDWSFAERAIDIYGDMNVNFVGVVKGDIDGSWGMVP